MDEQGGLIHEIAQRIRFHDCGPDLRLAVPAALRFFEEIALVQSEALGYGFAYYHENGVGWLLSRWDLTISALPAFDERVTVRTQPRECGKLAANRAFELVGVDGSPCIEGMSQWIFVDLARLRPARIPADLAAAYGMTPQKGQPPFPGETLPRKGEDCATEIAVRATDIDLNGHVNNVCYVEWALASLPEEVANQRMTRMRVHFKSETRLKALVRVAARAESGAQGTLVHQALSEGDRTACLVTTEWSNQPAD